MEELSGGGVWSRVLVERLGFPLEGQSRLRAGAGAGSQVGAGGGVTVSLMGDGRGRPRVLMGAQAAAMLEAPLGSGYTPRVSGLFPALRGSGGRKSYSQLGWAWEGAPGGRGRRAAPSAPACLHFSVAAGFRSLASGGLAPAWLPPPLCLPSLPLDSPTPIPSCPSSPSHSLLLPRQTPALPGTMEGMWLGQPGAAASTSGSFSASVASRDPPPGLS